MLQPEVVVITGASAGVGRATAREFARRGARIGLVARGRERLFAVRREVEDLGGQALLMRGDVADPSVLEEVAARVELRYGPIDVWINNAMVSVFSPVSEMMAQEYRRVTEVTYLGAVNGTLAALRRMRLRDRGTIIQVGTLLAHRGIPLQSAYCAAKHALKGFTESLRTELLHENSRIRLAEVHLPALNTPQFDWAKSRLPRRAQPLPPIIQPEVAARAIYWAAHHDRRQVFVGGQTLAGVFLQRFAPRFLDRRLARVGYEGQQAEEPENPSRAHNLWEPPPGDPGVHGRFDALARERSLQLWLTRNRRWLSYAGAGAGIVAAILSRTTARKPALLHT